MKHRIENIGNFWERPLLRMGMLRANDDDDDDDFSRKRVPKKIRNWEKGRESNRAEEGGKRRNSYKINPSYICT
jgi:hypothetical protein